VSVGALLDERPAEPPIIAERLLSILRQFERLPAADREELTLFLERLLATVAMLRGR
jgi:hypothetical protein